MYQVDDKPETIHLYVVREEEARPSLLPVVFALFALFLLIVLGIVTPYEQPEQRASIRVPAILLPLKTFTVSVAVIPTGVKIYPATAAHGLLTITNGSILSEELPQGMILTGKDGVEIVTDAAVYVPSGSATGLGYAMVSAHAAKEGKSGNIQTLDMNAVEGTSLYIRNLHPFSDGADSYSVKFVTAQDKQTALTQARAILLPQTVTGLLESPCQERVAGSQVLSVVWTCQYVRYNIPDLPGVKVLHAEVRGTIILLDVVFVARPRILTTK